MTFACSVLSIQKMSFRITVSPMINRVFFVLPMGNLFVVALKTVAMPVFLLLMQE